MATPGRDPQRSLQAWRLLNDGFRVFTTKVGRNYRMGPHRMHSITLLERRDLKDAMGRCMSNVGGLLHTLRARHLRLDVRRLQLMIEQSELNGELMNRQKELWQMKSDLCERRVELFRQAADTELMSERLEEAKRITQLLEKRRQKLETLVADKDEMLKSRSMMLNSRMIDLSQELLTTKIRIHNLEHSKAQLERRIEEQELTRLHRRRRMMEQLKQLCLAQERWQWDRLVPQSILRVCRFWRGLWDCVGSLAWWCRAPLSATQLPSAASGLNLYVPLF
ncbi:hypothetical protein KR018_004274 [Drosophila ironensis]|nr:hypothetical protein KR018_004274 [Drosophila ironensis]